jgi:peptidoglycan/LPS O-acetylase OafA/YrhL
LKPGSPGEYRPQLDGLRAVAVAAVAWSHWERPYQFGIPFGAGVHLFYVLSGFLITTILLRVRAEADRTGALQAFYIRRALRIFPAFYLTLALAGWADIPLVRESMAWHVAYLSNVFTFVRGEWPGSISHFWSLAVEEQFYLVWPWLIVFAPRAWIVPGIAIAIASGPAFRWWLAAEGYRESMIGILTPGCLDSLGVGALLAVRGLQSAIVGGRVTAIALAGYAGLIGLERFGVVIAPLVATKGLLQAVVFGWLVVRAARGFRGVTGRILSSAPMLYIGRISYGVYLAHGFAGAIAATMFALLGLAWPAPEPWRFVILCAATVGAAAVSWHLMERPVNDLKRWFPYRAAAARYESRRPLSADTSP